MVSEWARALKVILEIAEDTSEDSELRLRAASTIVQWAPVASPSNEKVTS